MADVMISYARADAFIVAKLSALLEASGYSTWWDDRLLAGERFRTRIMLEISNARAVIVLWSAASVTSDWVRAEAGRARQLGKLVPAKIPQLATDAIPLPFGELHTLNVEDERAIVEAIKREISKPTNELTARQRVLALLRHQALGWVGILGGVVTLTANFAGVVKLAEVFRVILENWSACLVLLWRTLLFFHIHVGPLDAIFLTVTVLVGGNLAIATIRARERNPSSSAKVMSALAALFGLLLIVGAGYVGLGTAVARNYDLAAKEFSRSVFGDRANDPLCAEAAVRAFSVVRWDTEIRSLLKGREEAADQLLDSSFGRRPPLPPPNLSHIEDLDTEGSVYALNKCMIALQIALEGKPGSVNPSAEFDRIVKKYADRAKNQVSQLGWFGLFGQVILPLFFYAFIRIFIKRRVDVALFAKRLWFVIGGTAVLLLVNEAALWLGRVDWTGLLAQ